MRIKSNSRIVFIIFRNIFLLGLIGIVYFYLFQKLGFGIPCVFNLVTGLKCPGCGMTHALASVLQGDFLSAYEYNRLSITLFPVFSIYILYRVFRKVWNPDKEFYIWEYVLLVIMAVITFGYAYFRNKY